ncbi:hypothetical protein [Methylobacterium sp. A54F]
MINYIIAPRPNHAATVHPEILYTLQPSRAFELPANNATARIAFAEIALEHILADPAIGAGPLCFVTITPSVSAFPVGDRRARLPIVLMSNARARRGGPAAEFDVFVLQQIARQALGDTPFIGMVEAALFRRWGPDGPSCRDWISWHCHLIVWGIAPREVSRQLAPLRKRHRSMLENVPAAHVDRISLHNVPQKLVYMLKAPQKIYRVGYFSKPWKDRETGKTRQPGLHVNKDWLQTGDRIRLLDVMGHRTLDHLMFGSREGTTLVNAIRAEALAPFRSWKARQPWMQRA